MSLKKICPVVFFLFIIQLQSQTATITIPFLDNDIDTIEAILFQETTFAQDTLTLKKHLQPLLEITKYTLFYDGLLANGYAHFYNALNPQSKYHYLKSINNASTLKKIPFEIWAQLNYISYLYYYRDFKAMTPLLLRVIEQMERQAPETLILPGKSYKKIGWILQTLEDYEEAFKYLNLAKTVTPINTAEYAAILDALGLNHLYTGSLNNAESFFQEAADISRQIKDDLRYAKALGNLAMVQQEKGNFDAAISLLKEDISISELKNEDQNTVYASIQLAKLLIAIDDLENARHLLNIAQNIVQSKNHFQKMELQIIQLKLEILKQLNRTEDELELRRRMVVLDDSLKNKDGDNAIEKANWSIQKSRFEQNLVKTRGQFKSESLSKNIFIGLVVLVVLLSLLLYKRQKKQLNNRALLYEHKAATLKMKQFKTERELLETHEDLSTQIDYLKDKNKQIKKLKAEIDLVKKSASPHLEKKTSKLTKLLESHLMTDENWNRFKKEFQKEHPEFYFLLQNDFPELTDSNKRIVLLQKLKFKNNEIAELLGITTDAVKKSKMRLKRKLGEKYALLSEQW